MGAAPSSDNEDLTDYLVKNGYIRSVAVERAFRLVDRGRFLPEQYRNEAYRDAPFKCTEGLPGQIHLSAPCIYGNVLEMLELQQGQSFLNIGSGTGYLSTMAGFLIGELGVNHGVEIHSNVLDFARDCLNETLRSPEITAFDWGPPEFFHGNGLSIDESSNSSYDRVYCGAAVPAESLVSVVKLLKIGGKLVAPIQDALMRITKTSETEHTSETFTSVSFSVLIAQEEQDETVRVLPAVNTPLTLRCLTRAAIRRYLREKAHSLSTVTMRQYPIEESQRSPLRPRAMAHLMFRVDYVDGRHAEIRLPYENVPDPLNLGLPGHNPDPEGFGEEGIERELVAVEGEQGRPDGDQDQLRNLFRGGGGRENRNRRLRILAALLGGEDDDARRELIRLGVARPADFAHFGEEPGNAERREEGEEMADEAEEVVAERQEGEGGGDRQDAMEEVAAVGEEVGEAQEPVESEENRVVEEQENGLAVGQNREEEGETTDDGHLIFSSDSSGASTPTTVFSDEGEGVVDEESADEEEEVHSDTPTAPLSSQAAIIPPFPDRGEFAPGASRGRRRGDRGRPTEKRRRVLSDRRESVESKRRRLARERQAASLKQFLCVFEKNLLSLGLPNNLKVFLRFGVPLPTSPIPN